ncbi:MAG: epoxyqueuosine reductase [Dehalococcoidia bacterium]|nr:epoxyqueuosine reductase [Dehalococcoidia bacterium]
MTHLSQLVIDYVTCLGACAVGIATIDTLAGGPPSADLTYVLPNANSAISFAIPLDQDMIPAFLRKEDRISHERDNYTTNGLASGLSLQLSRWLDQKGYPSIAQASNDVYRSDTPGGRLDMYPELSLRYLAVRSGVGHFGLSGNVITRDHGAAVILGCVVTTAKLEPTDPLPADESYCDKCRLCMASCASGLMHPKEKTQVELGGVVFDYSKRRSYLRCEYVCGGFTGLHSSGKWSTWSPGRFPIPDDDGDFGPALVAALDAYGKRPDLGGGYYHSLMRGKLWQTCGNCQLVCHPDKDERKRRYKMLSGSGVVVQQPDGTLEAMSPENAISFLSGMDLENRALYEGIESGKSALSEVIV